MEEGFDWSMSLERAFRKSKRAMNRGIGPARQSEALDLGAAFKALENRSSAPVCNRGPVGLRNLLVVGCFWMLRELEISCAKVCHLEVDAVHFWVDWTLPASKTDVRALGKVRRWECVCSGDFTRPCPFHAIVNQLEILRSSHRGEGSSPLFPTISGGFVDKRHVVTSIEFVARLIGEALTGFGGVRRFGGHSLRVTGARLMAGMGISIVLIQLMARWSSEAVLRYVAEAPLQGMSNAYRKGLSTSALGTSAEETSRQLEVVKSETVQDKRLIHYLQQEVATLKAIEDVKVKNMGYIVNTESGVVHRPVVWAKDVVPIHWRTACGWAFGFRWCRRWELFSAGGVRGKGTKQFLAVWHRATRRILLRCPILQTFPARHRIDCWAKGVRMEALQSSSLIKKGFHRLLCGWAGGIHCMIVVTNRAQRCEDSQTCIVLVGWEGQGLACSASCCYFDQEQHCA